MSLIAVGMLWGCRCLISFRAFSCVVYFALCLWVPLLLWCFCPTLLIFVVHVVRAVSQHTCRMFFILVARASTWSCAGWPWMVASGVCGVGVSVFVWWNGAMSSLMIFWRSLSRGRICF